MSSQYSVLLFSILLMMGCMSKGVLSTADGFLVQWFPGFTMAEQLAKKVPVHNQHDVQALLDKPWDFSYKLANLQTG